MSRNSSPKLTQGKTIPTFRAGDTLKVGVKVIEGQRERIQFFEGVCIARSNKGLNSNFTVRKISFGEGVERVFPLYAPIVASIDVLFAGAMSAAPNSIICASVRASRPASRNCATIPTADRPNRRSRTRHKKPRCETFAPGLLIAKQADQRRRRTAARPAKPAPSSIRLAGSGVGVPPEVVPPELVGTEFTSGTPPAW